MESGCGLGRVALRVREPERAVDFYCDVPGRKFQHLVYRARLRRPDVKFVGKIIVHRNGSRSLHFSDPGGIVVERRHR